MERYEEGDLRVVYVLEQNKKYIYLENKKYMKIITGINYFYAGPNSVLVEVGKNYAPNEYYWRHFMDDKLYFSTPMPIKASIENEFFGNVHSEYYKKIKNTGQKIIGYFPIDKNGNVIGTFHCRAFFGFAKEKIYKKIKRIWWNKDESKIYFEWS